MTRTTMCLPAVVVAVVLVGTVLYLVGVGKGGGELDAGRVKAGSAADNDRL